MSAMNSGPVYLKAGSGAALVQPAPNNVAATKTITAAAVQQMRQGDSTAALARHVLPAPLHKRARLVGPPPAFEVNLLQHMKETRDQTAPHGAAQPDGPMGRAPGAGMSGEIETAEDTAMPPAYGMLSGITAEQNADPPILVNKFL